MFPVGRAEMIGELEVDEVTATKRWLERIVVGLDLCPFAGRVFRGGLIKYVVSDAADPATLLEELRRELESLAATPIEEVETTLLIHPRVLTDFLDYNDFLDDADLMLQRLDLDGVIQVASFHPDYRFADTDPDAVENHTNRSPYPMLHLLREESVSRVAGMDLDSIPQRNIALLRSMGLEEVRRLSQ